MGTKTWQKTVISYGSSFSRETQAEISFKAGKQEGAKELYLITQARILGINEFTDYSPEGMKEFRKMVTSFFNARWQAKLKEWNLEAKP